MGLFDLSIFILKSFVPSFFSVLFRAYGLGYKSRKSLAVGISVFTVFMITVPAVLILTMGYGKFTHVSTWVSLIAGMSVLIFTTDSVGKTIFLQLTQNCMNTAVSVFVNLIRTEFHLSYTTLVLMQIVASILLYIIALRYWAKPLRFIADNIRAELPSVIMMPAMVIGIVYILPTYPAQSFANHPIYITMMMLAVICVFMLYIFIFYRNLLKIEELAKAETKNQLLESEISSYREYLQAAKQSRHDMRHHNALVLEYLKENDTERAVEYLNSCDVALESATLKQYCENSTANAVLCVFDRRAAALDVSLGIQADIPKQLPLEASEIGALFSNLLENAFEALEKVEPVKRSISFSSQREENGLRLEIRNSSSCIAVFENDLPKSTKVSGGTGTKSIAAIVKKYNGILRFKQENQEFIVRIFIPI